MKDFCVYFFDSQSLNFSHHSVQEHRSDLIQGTDYIATPI